MNVACRMKICKVSKDFDEYCSSDNAHIFKDANMIIQFKDTNSQVALKSSSSLWKGNTLSLCQSDECYYLRIGEIESCSPVTIF